MAEESEVSVLVKAWCKEQLCRLDELCNDAKRVIKDSHLIATSLDETRSKTEQIVHDLAKDLIAECKDAERMAAELFAFKTRREKLTRNLLCQNAELCIDASVIYTQRAEVSLMFHSLWMLLKFFGDIDQMPTLPTVQPTPTPVKEK